MASQNGSQTQLAQGLGWFSIGLGLAEVAAPKALSRFIGLEGDQRTRWVMRLYGLREIAAGIGILSQQQTAGWMWGRVAGDVLDLTALGAGMTSDSSDRTRMSLATAAVLGVTAADVLCARNLSRSEDELEGTGEGRGGGAIHVTKTIIVGRSQEDVYGFWRNFSNLPTFMKHLESVETMEGGRSHWKAKAPAGRTVEWDAELVADEPNSRIEWRSLEGADVDNRGWVRFERAPGGRGTLVRVELDYSPPGGAIGSLMAKLFGEEPGQQVDDDLRRFKQVMETGEIARSDASIHPGMHAAQPSARAATA